MNKNYTSKKIVENEIKEDYWSYGYYDESYEHWCNSYCKCDDCYYDDCYYDWMDSRKRKIELFFEDNSLMNTAKIINKEEEKL